MNKLKLPALALGLVLLATSCKKTDLQHPSLPAAPTATAVAPAKASGWKNLTNWTSVKGNQFTTFATRVSDSSITADVAHNGLVLAFAKNGNSIQALPFQEKDARGAYWYYQVANGKILVNCDSYINTQPASATGLRYFVFSASRLKTLEAQGYSKIKLMQLTYEDLSSLVKN